MRRVHAGVPVILTSGYNEIEATRRFTSKGLAGFLQKPFTPHELAAKLAAALKKSSAS
jgi:DNA-binding NtrC family response regulator